MKKKYFLIILFLILAIFLVGCGVITPAIPTPVVELVKPLDDYTNNISQRFGNYLGYYGGKYYDGFHSGEDISVVAGTPVYAITSGRVAKISDLGALGHLIVLEHNKGPFKIPGRNEEIDGQSYHYPSEEVDMVYSVYIHVDPGDLSKNDWVETGEKIADIADISAAGLGAHLHFEIRHPDQEPSSNWTMVGDPSDWSQFADGTYNGYYKNLQEMVDAGLRHPSDFLGLASPPITPTTILSPVVGDLEIVSSIEQCSNTKWCFNQHKSGYHCQGGGICQADDTYAWDVNLNTPSHDSDNGMPVYAVEGGIISQTYGGCINAGGSYGQLLIEHTYQGNPWWSGYLHLKDIQVTTGQSVDQNTLLGYISNTSPETIPNHLHFVVYKGQNSPSGLISFDANIIPRDFSQTYYTITASAGPNGSISPSGDITVNQGSDKSFTITPDNGYIIDDVLVDGISVGAVSLYTFTNVTEDHTIYATFINVAPGLVHNINKGTYYNTIQAALDDADNDNTIEVSNGTYDESITFPSGKKLTLQSINGASSTTIRGDNDLATVTFNGSLEATLEGFTITHTSGNNGRGIYISNSYLTINNCIVSDNSARDGGGIYNGTSRLTITESIISNNSADHGGGIDNIGSLTIIESIISGNTSDWGGGISNSFNSTLNIITSTISNNFAIYDGGGIYNYESSLTITESTISGNHVSCKGGGIYKSSPYPCYTLDITVSTISGNSADNGGGIYFDFWGWGPFSIGGSSDTDKNTICGNYKIGYSPSLDQQIRDDSGSLYETYKDTNYISVYCD